MDRYFNRKRINGANKGLVVDGKAVAGNTVPLTGAPVCSVELTV